MRKYLAVLVLTLAACSTTAPRGFDDYAADVLQGTDAIVQTTRTLLASGKLSKAEALLVANAAQHVRDGVEVARGVAVSKGQSAGTAQLRAAADELDAITAMLAKKGK